MRPANSLEASPHEPPQFSGLRVSNMCAHGPTIGVSAKYAANRPNPTARSIRTRRLVLTGRVLLSCRLLGDAYIGRRSRRGGRSDGPDKPAPRGKRYSQTRVGIGAELVGFEVISHTD